MLDKRKVNFYNKQEDYTFYNCNLIEIK